MQPFSLQYLGDGEFKALHPKRADRELVVGEVLKWEVVQDRSDTSHRHFFACVNSAWETLPERLVLEFPDADSLRKYALIRAGYCKRYSFAFKSQSEAKSALKAMQELDGYAVGEIVGNVLKIAIAESQSLRSMGKKRFQESKNAVFQVLSELLGADIAKAPERAA